MIPYIYEISIDIDVDTYIYHIAPINLHGTSQGLNKC